MWFNQYTFKAKEVFNTIYERIIQEHKKIKKQIKSLKSKLKRLPDGKLVCCRNKNRYKWYTSDLHTKTYIPKKNRKLAEQLALKKYLSLQLEDLEAEENAISFYLRHHKNSGKAVQLLLESPEYQSLLSPYFTPLSQELAEWTQTPYQTNPFYPEHRIHKSPSGNILRSKSEVIIDMFLHANKIPFRYEAAVEFEENTLYPDFTIRHPKTGEVFYWEHFGMMDVPAYAQKALAKLQLYITHNIIPSVQLIATYETKEQPLSTEVVEKIIEHYFL